MLDQIISDFLLWMIDRGYSPWIWHRTEGILRRFAAFVRGQGLAFEDIFTLPTLAAFKKVSKDHWYTAHAFKNLWQFAFEQGKTKMPFPKQRQTIILPKTYESYLTFYAQHIQSADLLTRARKVLCAFDDYLQKHHIRLATVRIYDLDTFLIQYNVPYTISAKRLNCSCLRGFLRYLYQQQILTKDLASLLALPRLNALAKPPKFLRPRQVQELFSQPGSSSSKQLRANAMLHLAYTCGLRPKEVSAISLDDICFQQRQVRILDRKCQNPIILPLPEETIKALAAYIVCARPKVKERAVFLSLQAPYKPISTSHAVAIIGDCMRKAHPGSASYWLRHTYAQNLLESGASIFEIKDMLGHTSIRSTQQYIRIHTKLMREVLFDEIL